MAKIIQLFTDGTVEVEGRESTRLMGGFESGEECMSDLQVARLLKHKNGARHVRELINNNKQHFKDGVHIMDVKSSVGLSDSRKTLEQIGYTPQSFNLSKSIYILSSAGFLLYLKFAEGENSIEVYKDFMEKYFKTLAENKVMEEAIQEDIDVWKKRKATAVGMTILADTEADRAKAMMEVEDINKQINKLQDAINKEKTIELLKPQLDVAELLSNAKFDYDINTLSKALDIQGLGRNNLFKWMRDKEILRKNNEPYQQYMKYFKVIYTTSDYGYQSSKTLVRPVGVEYLIKRLKKDGKVVTKSVKEILSELEGEVA